MDVFFWVAFVRFSVRFCDGCVASMSMANGTVLLITTSNLRYYEYACTGRYLCPRSAARRRRRRRRRLRLRVHVLCACMDAGKSDWGGLTHHLPQASGRQGREGRSPKKKPKKFSSLFPGFCFPASLPFFLLHKKLSSSRSLP